MDVSLDVPRSRRTRPRSGTTERVKNFFSRKNTGSITPEPPRPESAHSHKDGLRDLAPLCIRLAKQGHWSECLQHLPSTPDIIRDPSSDQTCLHIACMQGDLSAVRQLVNAGCDVNARDKWKWAPLHCSSNGRYIGSQSDASKFLESLVFLADHGADVSIEREDGSTCLHNLAVWTASSERFLEVFEILLEGIKIDQKNLRGETIMHRAASVGNALLVNLLLKKGGSTDAVVDTLHTPLHYAAAAGSIDCIKALLDSGASLFAIDKDQHTARDLAFLTNRLECARYLDDMMASQGGKRLSRPLLENISRSYSPFDHIDVLVSMMGPNGRNYSSTSLIADPNLNKVGPDNLRSSFRMAEKVNVSPIPDDDSRGMGGGFAEIVSDTIKTTKFLRASEDGTADLESLPSFSQGEITPKGEHPLSCESPSCSPQPSQSLPKRITTNLPTFNSDPTHQVMGHQVMRFSSSSSPNPSSNCEVFPSVAEKNPSPNPLRKPMFTLQSSGEESSSELSQTVDDTGALKEDPPVKRSIDVDASERDCYDESSDEDLTICDLEEDDPAFQNTISNLIRTAANSFPAPEEEKKIKLQEPSEDTKLSDLIRLRGFSEEQNVWIIEIGAEAAETVIDSATELVLERSDYDDFYYIRNFVARLPKPREQPSPQQSQQKDLDVWETLLKEDFAQQSTFIGTFKGRNVIISIKSEPERESQSQSQPQYRGILRTYKQDLRFWLPARQSRRGGKHIISIEDVKKRCPEIKNLKETRSTKVLRSLVGLECYVSIQAHTIPIVLVSETPSKRSTIFTSLKSLNEKSRARFLQFVRSLGKEVDLARWEGYHGNLDVKFPFRHGRKAIAASLHQRHIMFPVLPWFLSHTAAEDLLCRCTTVLIYLESGHLDVPITVKDNFIHNYLVISPDKETEGFRVMDVFRCSIGRYRPTIPRDYLFLPGERFTQFLLYKMINADRAASHCRELDCLDILRRKNRQKLINAVVEGDLMDAAPQHRLNGSNPRELPASSPASSKKTKRKYRSNELKEKGGERERERKKSVGGSGDSPHVGFAAE